MGHNATVKEEVWHFATVTHRRCYLLVTLYPVVILEALLRSMMHRSRKDRHGHKVTPKLLDYVGKRNVIIHIRVNIMHVIRTVV